MADLTLESAVYKDGVLTIRGTGFTRTTTFVEIDGNQVPFELNEAGEIVVSNAPEGTTEVDVTKGDVTQTVNVTQDSGQAAAVDTDQSTTAGTEPYKTETPNTTPGDLSKDDVTSGTSDVSEEDLATSANAGAEMKGGSDPNAPDRTPLQEGEHLPGQDFRTKVESTPAGDLGKVIDPRQPYPTGNPPDPRETFHRIHGHYPPDEETKPNQTQSQEAS